MQYEGYVKQNQCEMMNYLKEEDQMPFINLMAEKNYFSKEGIEAAIDWASRKQKTELLSILMNEQHLQKDRSHKQNCLMPHLKNAYGYIIHFLSSQGSLFQVH